MKVFLRVLTVFCLILACGGPLYADHQATPTRGSSPYLEMPRAPYLQAVFDGEVPNHLGIFKFGTNADVASGASEFIGYKTGVFTPDDYSTYTIHISSADAGDDQDVLITGTDVNFALQTVAVVLDGTTETTVSGVWTSVNRVTNDDDTVFAGDVYVYKDDTVTAGVPQTASKIRIVVPTGSQQSQHCGYMVPADHSGSIYLFTHSGDNSYNIAIKLLLPNGVQKQIFRDIMDVDKGSIPYNVNFEGSMHLPEKTQILVYAKNTGTGDSIISAKFAIVLTSEDEPYISSSVAVFDGAFTSTTASVNVTAASTPTTHSIHTLSFSSTLDNWMYITSEEATATLHIKVNDFAASTARIATVGSDFVLFPDNTLKLSKNDIWFPRGVSALTVFSETTDAPKFRVRGR